MAGLTVVVPALNEARHLPSLLADLQRWPNALEIVVVDGGSTDKTIQVAHQGGARVLQSPVQGRGQQLQHGLQSSQHAWLLILHAEVGSARTGSTTSKGFTPWRKDGSRLGRSTFASMNAGQC